jgi:hypothetical protein
MTNARKSLGGAAETVSPQVFILAGTLCVIAAMASLLGW